jgi:hypothetical protein
LASSVNPAAPGEPVTLTASVVPTPDGGTVSFADNGAPITECQDVAADASGDATCVVTYASDGTHAIVATYSGDAAFAGSRSTALDQAVTTPTGFTATATPSSASYGHAIELSASGLSFGPASTVTFESGSTTLCVALVIEQAATCSTIDQLTPGDYPVTATWSGPPELKATTSFTITQLDTSIEAHAKPVRTSYGNAVRLAVSGLSAAATGTVAFTSGSTTLCVATVFMGRFVHCSTAKNLPPYAYPVTATYSGDANYAGATATTSFTITKHKTSMAAKATATSRYNGHPVRLSVHGLPLGATGTVTFTSGSITLCVAIGQGVGRVSCLTAPDLAKGTYRVLATYSGDGNYAGTIARTRFTVRKNGAVTTASETAAFSHSSSWRLG